MVRALVARRRLLTELGLLSSLLPAADRLFVPSVRPIPNWNVELNDSLVSDAVHRMSATGVSPRERLTGWLPVVLFLVKLPTSTETARAARGVSCLSARAVAQVAVQRGRLMALMVDKRPSSQPPIRRAPRPANTTAPSWIF